MSDMMISEKDNTSSNVITSEKAGTSNEKMPWPAFSEVFIFRPTFSNKNNFAFSCKFCVGEKIIHANKSSSANLKKHVNVSFISFTINIIFQYYIFFSVSYKYIILYIKCIKLYICIFIYYVFLYMCVYIIYIVIIYKIVFLVYYFLNFVFIFILFLIYLYIIYIICSNI